MGTPCHECRVPELGLFGVYCQGVAVADAVRALVLVVWTVSAWVRTLHAAPMKMDVG